MDTPRNPNPIERDEAILQRAADHVCIADHFAPLFSSPKACYRRVAKLRARKQLRCVGIVQLGPRGRPHYAYCNSWRPKQDHLRHEVLVTTFLLQYPQATIRRGYAVDQTLLPDAEMEIEDRFFFVELDVGTESHAQVRRRQRIYAEAKWSGFILWVCLTERRMRNLVLSSELVQDVSLFTTLDRVLREPRGLIWIDRAGHTGAI